MFYLNCLTFFSFFLVIFLNHYFYVLPSYKSTRRGLRSSFLMPCCKAKGKNARNSKSLRLAGKAKVAFALQILYFKQ